jgi:hypothetical protein
MLHAQAQNSDPFAKRRMALHIDKGFDQPRKVIEAATTALKARDGKTTDATHTIDVPRNAFVDALKDFKCSVQNVTRITKRVKRKLRPLVKQAA